MTPPVARPQDAAGRRPASRDTAGALRRTARATLGVAVVTAGLAALAVRLPSTATLSIVLTVVAAALLVLTRATWWRVLAGAAVAWSIGACVSLVREGAGAALTQALTPASGHGRMPHPAQTALDLALGAVALVLCVAALLAVAGSLRIRRGRGERSGDESDSPSGVATIARRRWAAADGGGDRRGPRGRR